MNGISFGLQLAGYTYAVAKLGLDWLELHLRCRFMSTKKFLVLWPPRVQVDIGELCIVTGKVGSGKSSLLSAVLGEMRKESGSITLSGDNHALDRCRVLSAMFCRSEAGCNNSEAGERQSC